MLARAWIGIAAVAMVLAAGCGGADDDRTTAPIVVPEPAEPEPAEPAGAEPASAEEPALVIGEDTCTSDADCVPAECCHAAACVGRANAPDCGDAMCTMECRYGTLDCGGACLCHEGRCAARLSQPEIEGEPPPQ